MSRRINLVGQRFGRLVVRRFVGANRHRHSLWECVCGCGNITIASTLCLRGGKTKSCGCLQPGITVDEQGRPTRLYRIWCGMKQRCCNPNSKDFPRYGGRGITLCPEWQEFPAFYAWAMANGYRDDLTLDRIDNDGPYSPENCRWVPVKRQARNRRSNVILTFNGQSRTLAEWADILGVARGTLEQRLRRGWPVDKVLTTPVKGKALKEAS